MADEVKEQAPSYMEQFMAGLSESEHQEMFQMRVAIYEAIGPVALRKHNKAALYAAIMTAVAVGGAQEEASKRMKEEDFVALCQLGYRACKEFFLRRAVDDVIAQVKEQLEGAPAGARKH